VSTASDQPSVPPISASQPFHSFSVISFYSFSIKLPQLISSFPPDTPSPAPVPTHPPPFTRPQHTRRPQNEWLRDQYVVPERYRQPREPTPVIPSSDEEDNDSDDPFDILQASAASTAEPTTYRQSQHRPDADLWHTACQEEMEAHSLNGTWEVVKLPSWEACYWLQMVPQRQNTMQMAPWTTIRPD